jgi:phosphate transport system protein
VPGKGHIDQAFEAELASLREQLLRMAGRVERMIRQSVEAFEERSLSRANATIALDHEVNQAEVDIDELCLVILARRQPMGRDLRFVTLALKMVTDLERIADLAVNVCERAAQLGALPPLESDVTARMPEMAVHVESMVHDAIQAFIESDEKSARDVIARDAAVDELYHGIFRAVLARMVEDASLVERGIHVQSVAKFLERMGDHATNLAEQVVLLERGVDLRHMGKR